MQDESELYQEEAETSAQDGLLELAQGHNAQDIDQEQVCFLQFSTYSICYSHAALHVTYAICCRL